LFSLSRKYIFVFPATDLEDCSCAAKRSTKTRSIVVDFLVITSLFSEMMCRSSVVNEQPLSSRKKPLESGVSLRSFHWLTTAVPSG